MVYRIRRKPNGKPRVVHFNSLAPFLGDNKDEEKNPVAQVCNVQSEEKTFEEFMMTPYRRIRHGVTVEIEQDLFDIPEDNVLAYCVAQDMKMTSGIAKVIMRKYGMLYELKAKNLKIGEAVHSQHGKQHLFYMTNKETSEERTEYAQMWNCLRSMRDQMLQLNLMKLGIPKISDGMDWKVVRNMIQEIFHNTGINVLVCCYNPRYSKNIKKSVPCYFFKASHCREGSKCRFIHLENSVRDELN